MKKIALIGSTGSIGRQVIDVAARYPDRFQIVAMAANENADRFSRQVEKIRPRFAVLRKESAEISAFTGPFSMQKKETVSFDFEIHLLFPLYFQAD